MSETIYVGCHHSLCDDHRQATREELMDALGIPEDRRLTDHIVTIKEDGWHMAHPITCGLDACDFDVVARGWEKRPRPFGRYRWSTPEQWPGEWERIFTEDGEHG